MVLGNPYATVKPQAKLYDYRGVARRRSRRARPGLELLPLRLRFAGSWGRASIADGCTGADDMFRGDAVVRTTLSTFLIAFAVGVVKATPRERARARARARARVRERGRGRERERGRKRGKARARERARERQIHLCPVLSKLPRMFSLRAGFNL